VVTAENDHEVDPSFREEIARVPVEDFGAGLLHELKLVE
jgi:hypothetical protein